MKISIQATAYGAVMKRTVTPIQKLKKECMMIPHQKKVILVNNETSRRDPDSSLIIYLTAAKLAQCGMMSGNRR